MRLFAWGILVAVLAISAPNSSSPAHAAENKPKDKFFTGTVTAVDPVSITVNRIVLGKNSSTKTFLVDADTRFEGGQPQIRSQITVRYVTMADGERAVHIILRRSPK